MFPQGLDRWVSGCLQPSTVFLGKVQPQNDTVREAFIISAVNVVPGSEGESRFLKKKKKHHPEGEQAGSFLSFSLSSPPTEKMFTFCILLYIGNCLEKS